MATDRFDEGFDAAWAQIVAGYDQQVDGSTADRPYGESQAGDGDDPPEDTYDRSDPSGVPDSGADVGADVGTAVRSRPAPWDDEGHYLPPPPPPLPRPGGAVGVAWLGVVLGPVLLLLAAALDWSMPPLLMSACVLGFVGGVVFLILQLDDDRADADGWDDGAQI